MDPAATKQTIMDCLTSARAYAGSQLFEHFNGLLESLAQSHMQDLVDIPVEKLEAKQGAIRQLRSLIRALNGDVVFDPKT